MKSEGLKMTIEQFRGYLRARPFVAFSIQLADSREIEVHHPENALVSEPGRTAAVVNKDGVIETIDLLLVTSLRPLNGRAKARPRRGKRKTR
jgi:hypothetical protein